MTKIQQEYAVRSNEIRRMIAKIRTGVLKHEILKELEQ